MECRQTAREKESKRFLSQDRTKREYGGNTDRGICGELRQNLDVHFDDFLIGHGSRIRSSINPKLSGAGARIDKPSEQEINYIDFDESRPRFSRFPRLRRLHQHLVRDLLLLQCIG